MFMYDFMIIIGMVVELHFFNLKKNVENYNIAFLIISHSIFLMSVIFAYSFLSLGWRGKKSKNPVLGIKLKPPDY